MTTTKNNSYNTDLASEFYVLSLLYRIGIDASLTLGNKKSVDIMVATKNNRNITIDVKGVAGKFDWPADNIRTTKDNYHFYALLSFEGKIGDVQLTPSIWVIPSTKINGFIKSYSTRKVISRKSIKEKGEDFKNAWHLLNSK